MRAYLVGAAIGALGLAAAASAAQPAPPPPPGVAQGTAPAPMTPPPPPGAPQQVRVRVVSDRVMTRDEVAKNVAEIFARLDTNHDGFITKQEVEAFHAQMEAKMQAAMAKVGDVKMIDDRGALFDRLDTNHDGSISRQEFMAGKPEVRTERVMIMRPGADGTPGAPPSMDGHPGMAMRMEMHGPGMSKAMALGMGGFGMRLFEMADTNHDGRVSLAEAQAAALAHFDKADLNHDGKITPDERRQMREEIRFEHRPS